jgi:hypothetical protein
MKREKVKHYYPDQFTPWDHRLRNVGYDYESRMKAALMTNNIILKLIHGV